MLNKLHILALSLVLLISLSVLVGCEERSTEIISEESVLGLDARAGDIIVETDVQFYTLSEGIILNNYADESKLISFKDSNRVYKVQRLVLTKEDFKKLSKRVSEEAGSTLKHSDLTVEKWIEEELK